MDNKYNFLSIGFIPLFIFLLISCDATKNEKKFKLEFSEKLQKQRKNLVDSKIIVEKGHLQDFSAIFVFSGNRDCYSCIDKGVELIIEMAFLYPKLNILMFEYNPSDISVIDKSNIPINEISISNSETLFYYIQTPIILFVNKELIIKDAVFIDTRTNNSIIPLIENAIPEMLEYR